MSNEDFEFTINRCYTGYMQQTNDVLFNLLDSHDTKRLRSDVKNMDEFFQQLAVLFSMPGSPVFIMERKLQWKADMIRTAEDVCPGEKLKEGNLMSGLR